MSGAGRRIAIATDWFSPRLGGIEAQLAQLAERLARRGHTVEVITSTPGEDSDNGFRTHRLNVARLPGLDVAVSPRLIEALRSRLARSHDVVHAHVSVISPVGWAAAWVARTLGIPTVVTFHSVLHAKRGLLALATRIGGMDRSPVVWSAVSELVALQAQRALNVPVLELSNGVDLATWRQRGADRMGQTATVITACRLHRKKRIRELLMAFARAAARWGGPARLVILGDGPDRLKLENVVRDLGLGAGRATVELPGWVDAASLRSRFADADLFALTSYNEAFGIAALEARSAGLPVLAMARAGCAEFLRGDPDAVLCANDEEFTAALASLLRNVEHLRARRQGSVPPLLERYDWSNVLGAHERAYTLAMKRAGDATGAGVW